MAASKDEEEEVREKALEALRYVKNQERRDLQGGEKGGGAKKLE